MRSIARSTHPDVTTPARLLRGAGYSARVRPWPSDSNTAHLVLMDQRCAPPSSVLRSWLHDLRDQGFHQVRTGAVHIEQQAPFLALGFGIAQHLTLLHCSMAGQRRGVHLWRSPIRRAQPRDLELLAALDASAFPVGWGLDAVAISDAAAATPKHRIGVIDDRAGHPVAYAISGRAGQAAFLQRLAVAPAAQGHGFGGQLVADCLRWSSRWNAQTVAVNTQVDNERALRLYESAGFVRRPSGLTVMHRCLDGAL